MKGLRIVPARGTYFTIEIDGVPVTNETFTKAQADERLVILKKVYDAGYDRGWDDSQ